MASAGFHCYCRLFARSAPTVSTLLLFSTVNFSDRAGELLGGNALPGSNLQKWGQGAVLDRLNRYDPGDGDARSASGHRVTLVVLGVTGAGKSSTANTIAGRTHKSFLLSDSMVSVTSSVSHRDYTFLGTDYRVIDTPGLADTSRDPAEVHAEVARLEALAPHGVDAFVVVVPRGRFTDLQRAALEEILSLFGQAVVKHACLAITSAVDTASTERHLLTRDELLEDLNGLPVGHFLRTFVHKVGLRIVPVENHLDPHRQSSRFLLHQRVDDVMAANGGRPFSVQGLAAAFATNRVELASQRSAVGAGPILPPGAVPAAPWQTREGQAHPDHHL